MPDSLVGAIGTETSQKEARQIVLLYQCLGHWRDDVRTGDLVLTRRLSD